MDTKFDFGRTMGERIVYVRAVDIEDLPFEVRQRMQGAKELYAVCNEDGEQIAFADTRKLAFILARQNDLAPVSAH